MMSSEMVLVNSLTNVNGYKVMHAICPIYWRLVFKELNMVNQFCT